MDELASSTDFQDLARVPLLLCMLVLRRMHDGYLPTSRFKAYEQLVELLTVRHPARRRKAAEIIESSSLAMSDAETKQVLAYLAFHMQANHADGVIDRKLAETLVRDYLKDAATGFGFPEREARRHAARLLNMGIETIGVLVDRSPTDMGFFHRIIQEYLAACYLLGLSLAEQFGVVEARGRDPQWREVLLCLFSMTPRSDDLRAFVDGIRAKSVHPYDRVYAEELSAEVTFGAFNCPNSLANEIAQAAFERIETESWAPHRERLLQRVLEGLSSARLRGTIQDRIGRWFPCTLGGREVIFDSMADWPSDPDVIGCLIKGMRDEEVAAQRSAGRALARLASLDEAVGDRVADLATHCGIPLARAAALTSLSLGWPGHPETSVAIESARSSPCPELRLAAITALIRRGEHTQQDFEELVRLGSWQWNVDYHWHPDIAEALVMGWAGTETLKGACLRYGQILTRQSQILSDEVAILVLLKAFPGDDGVADHFAQHIRQSEHPFIMLDMVEPWKLLAASFPNHPGLASAVDERFQRPHHLEPAIAAAALVGRTVRFKQKLLSMLNTSSVPFWASGSLLEGWGMEDPEVSGALEAVAFGEAGKASCIAVDLPEIVRDKDRCRQRLLDILRNPACKRPDIVFEGLGKLGTQGDFEAAEIVFTVLNQRPEWMEHPLWAMRARVIRLYSWDGRAKELAKQMLSSPDDHHPSVAIAYGADADIRKAILQRINPLPGNLREYIARKLNPRIGPSEFVLHTLGSCYSDPNASVKTEAAITYFTALKSSAHVPEAVIDRLREEIVHDREHEYWLRRQAAFVGMIILGRLDLYRESGGSGDGFALLSPATHHLQANPAFIRILLDHWKEIEPHRDSIALGVSDWRDFWEIACTQADEFPAAKDEAIKLFAENSQARPSANELRFLARAVPGGRLLLDKCLQALQIGQARSIDLGWETLAAAEILGNQFSHDEEVYERIIAECKSDWPPYHAILALCEGWPGSDVLERYRGHLSLDHVRNQFTAIVVIRYLCLKESAEGVWQMVNRLVTNQRPQNLAEATYAPLVRRVRGDDRLYEMATSELGKELSPTMKASLPRILIAARGITSELKTWCLAELENQMAKKRLSEIGFDLAARAYRPVSYALMDAMNSQAGVRRQ